MRARSSSLLYWLERGGLFFLFVAAAGLLRLSADDDLGWWANAIVGLVLASLWGRLDHGIKVRYGRKRRSEEVLAEDEARELAEVRAGRMHIPPVVS